MLVFRTVMKAAQVRSAFLDFFAKHGHERVASSSLVPSNDPTLLFTNAGMVQFKDVFTGAESRAIRRATTSQKCVRAGGKHNDLDEVGKTPRHHTFFEMLGNFSFGDYFKEDAIAWAWELLTEVFKIDRERLCITVFGGDPDKFPTLGPDDEARAMWRRVTGFGDDRIIGLGAADNFWMMGETGPMGPCSEIHYFGAGTPTAMPTTDPKSWAGWVEIWNLVFMQFERTVKDGPLAPLPAPSIDTGAGLERVTAALQGVKSNYDTDLFTGLIAEAAAIAGVTYGEDHETDTALRVIADHARCSAFLIADGVQPDKGGREYVLRRIFRRAVRHGKQQLGIDEPFMHRVIARVIEEMGSAYPELRASADRIQKVSLEEEKLFRRTLDRGIGLLEEEFVKMRVEGRTQVAGSKVFQLYDTYGFPDDLTAIIAGEHGYTIDKVGFEKEMEAAKGRSKFAGSDQESVEAIYKTVASQVGPTRFLGHENDGLSGEGKVLAIIADGAQVQEADAGQTVILMFDQSPFYAEAGGQIGDAGEIRSERGARVRIDDCKKPAGDVHVHFGVIEEGGLRVGDAVSFAVDGERRAQIRANHSATHLLHLALKRVLGSHVAQKGSLVAPDRLRFDFTHFSPITDVQKREIEDLVNAEIRRNADSMTEVLAIEEARSRGAVAMFGEKYGDKVRVVRIGNESLEFCGGTHVRRAGDIGLMKIVSEAGVAQGVRRIEAVTGAGALAYLRRLEDELGRAGERLRAGPFEIAARVEKMQGDIKALEKELGALKTRLASGGGARDLLAEARQINGVKLLAVALEVDDPKALRETGDQLRDRMGSGVLLLAGVAADKVSLLAMVSKDLVGRYHAGNLLGQVAEVLGGRGGGRPDMAQGGGKDPSKVPEALAAAARYVAEH
jgi:alanyl-tRNA synthetase